MSIQKVAHIYKIYNTADDKIFVGCCVNNIDSMLNKFQKASERLDNSPLYRHMKLIGNDKFKIELIENVFGDNEYIKTKTIGYIQLMKPKLNAKLYGADEEEKKAKINKSKMDYYHKHKNDPARIQKVKQYYSSHREDILKKRRERMAELGITVYEKKGRPRKVVEQDIEMRDQYVSSESDIIVG